MATTKLTTFLWTGWLLAAVLALACAAMFIAGIRRDMRAGEPSLDITLGSRSEWQTAAFRVWRDGRYSLFISTVNHDPARVGHSFTGELDVAVRRPDGSTLLARRLGPDTLAHSIPDNYGDTDIAALDLQSDLLRQWTVAVRVVRADPQFAGVPSELKLWRERVDPGMGGLVNYVMIIPAGVFTVVALLISLALARRGRTAPLLVTAAGLLAFLVWSGL